MQGYLVHKKKPIPLGPPWASGFHGAPEQGLRVFGGDTVHEEGEERDLPLGLGGRRHLSCPNAVSYKAVRYKEVSFKAVSCEAGKAGGGTCPAHTATSTDKMYIFISVRKPAPPQNRQLNVSSGNGEQ